MKRDRSTSRLAGCALALAVQAAAAPGPEGERDIVVVGARPPVVALAARRPVAGLDLGEEWLRTRSGGPAGAERDDQPPAGARWPDETGRIAVRGRPQEEPAARNPWEVPGGARATSQTVFSCGGVILGGPRGPVALLNGRPARPGEVVDSFRVARILPLGVVLERGDGYFVIPRSRSVTVETAPR